ncbi:unnamed protein product [Rotaria sp. Silwood1]|nr:unnamed protein product [Rotaria sp. Silwood1]
MYYHDLLALLDGRLKQLNTLNVVIVKQEYNPTYVYNMNLSHLKCFSLQYDCSSDAYDGEILPLLRRMSNIEVLNLNLIIDSPVPFIDDQQVECMIKYRRFPDVKYHLFSLPFMFDGLQFLDNTFPNIIFNHVIRLVVDDNIPFEHEFFMRIAWCFPLLKVLTVYNATSQSPILNYNDNQLYPTTIEYPYLTSLYLLLVHGDYVNRFLNDRKTHLPHLTVLSVNYNDLRNVTRNFTNDRIRLNCIQLKQLSIGPQKIAHSEDFYAYFPLL